MQKIQSAVGSLWNTYRNLWAKNKIVGGGATLVLLCVACSLCTWVYSLTPGAQQSTAATRVAREKQATAQFIETGKARVAAGMTGTFVAGVPTATNVPSSTPQPSETPKPTHTPAPTDTPRPTDTPTPIPEPIRLNGSGDSVVNFDNPFGPAVARIQGNAGARFFSVQNLDANGASLDLLVNTTDVYKGVRPLDFRAGEHTTRFEVNATGNWQIEVAPLALAESLNVPGKYAGKGDQVLLLTGATPDLAKISGNAERRFFAVIGYGGSSDLLVNTTDPYDGTVILGSDAIVLEVTATGTWQIELTGK